MTVFMTPHTIHEDVDRALHRGAPNRRLAAAVGDVDDLAAQQAGHAPVRSRRS
jgi:hypothetical protein